MKYRLGLTQHPKLAMPRLCPVSRAVGLTTLCVARQIENVNLLIPKIREKLQRAKVSGAHAHMAMLVALSSHRVASVMGRCVCTCAVRLYGGRGRAQDHELSPGEPRGR